MPAVFDRIQPAFRLFHVCLIGTRTLVLLIEKEMSNDGKGLLLRLRTVVYCKLTKIIFLQLGNKTTTHCENK